MCESLCGYCWGRVGGGQRDFVLGFGGGLVFGFLETLVVVVTARREFFEVVC